MLVHGDDCAGRHVRFDLRQHGRQKRVDLLKARRGEAEEDERRSRLPRQRHDRGEVEILGGTALPSLRACSTIA